MFLSSFHNFSLPIPEADNSSSFASSPSSSTSFTWDVGLILIATNLGLFVISLIAIVLNSGANLQHSKTSKVGYKKYFILTFCEWDYCVKDPEAGELKFAELRRRLLTELRLDAEKRNTSSRSFGMRVLLYGLRVLVNLASVAAVIGSFFLIRFVAEYSAETSEEFKQGQIGSNWSDMTRRGAEMAVEFLPAVAITLINVVVPAIFDILVAAERYNLEREVQVTLYRRVCLRIISLLFLIYAYYENLSANCRNWCGDVERKAKGSKTEGCKSMSCWEQIIGSQLYKLVLIDFLASLIAASVQMLKYFLAKCGGCMRNLAPVFDIPNNVLDLIYAQILCWLGILFCPIIPIMTCVKLVITFYVKRSLLGRKIFEPTRKMYRADRMANFFQDLLLISFFVSAAPVLFLIFKVQPSRSCGPFRVYSNDDYHMSDNILNFVFSLGKVPTVIFVLAFGQLTGIVIIILLSLLWYYYKTKDSAFEAAENMLQEMTSREEDKCNMLLRRARQQQVVFAKDNRQFFI